jgi:type IX secretion system PorP/SprF family membrane protein
VKGQDIQFTQFYAAPQLLNPAYTGLTIEHRFNANYREQWPGIRKAYRTYMVAYDYNMSDVNSGIGFYIYQDIAGTAGLTTTQGALNYAYRFKIDKNSEFRAGINIGYTIKRLNSTKLLFNDQLVTGSGISSDAGLNQDATYMDLGAGGLYNSQKFWLGVVGKHLNQPNVSLTGGVEGLPIYIGVHGGYRLIIESRGATKLNIKKYFAASFNYRHQLRYDQLDLGAYYVHAPISFGLWYRGIPFKRYKPGYPNRESFAVLVGLEVPKKNLRIGYSYDLTVSKLAINNTQGAHEITLIYEVAKKRKRNKLVVISCPKF